MEEILETNSGDDPPVIGKHTREAVCSGLIWGQVGAVNEIVSRMERQLRDTTETEGEFYLTGGAAELLQPHLQHPFEIYPQLTVQGLGLLP